MIMKNSKNTTRREFITKTGIIAAGVTLGANSITAASYNRISGANEKVRTGFIGIGNRGSQLLNLFMTQPELEVAALCDIYEPYLLRDRGKVDPRYLKDRPGQVPKMEEKFSAKPLLFNDYRKLLDDKSIDAVCIATPDHWHAIITIDAMKAGKDVYVEKPLTATIQEGRAMVNVQKATNRVVIVGLNRRGNRVYQKLAKDIPAGKIGKISVARAARISNMSPNGIGKLKPEQPPKDLNWGSVAGSQGFSPVSI
jgi:predicted dehydrogenase